MRWFAADGGGQVLYYEGHLEGWYPLARERGAEYRIPIDFVVELVFHWRTSTKTPEIAAPLTLEQRAVYCLSEPSSGKMNRIYRKWAMIIWLFLRLQCVVVHFHDSFLIILFLPVAFFRIFAVWKWFVWKSKWYEQIQIPCRYRPVSADSWRR